MSNIDEIINKLNNVITSGNEAGGNVLNVGILNDNALRKLSDAIRSSLKKTKEETSDNINKQNRENISSALNDAMTNYVEKGFKNLDNTITNGFTGLKRTLLSGFTRIFPIINFVATGIFDVTKSLTDTYYGTYLNVLELHKVGLNLNDGVASIYDAAGKIGISTNKLMEALTTNSQMVSQLSGIYKSANNNKMYEFLELSKRLSKEIGLSFDSTVNIAKTAHKDFAEHLLLTQGNLDTLTSKTETYIMFLDKLSKATGKSAESIAKETEARDKEISWRVLSMDPKNKMKIAIMTALGFSTDQQIATLTGMPNEASTLASLTPGYASIEQYIRNYNGKSGSELVYGLRNIANEYSPMLGGMISFLQQNPNLAFALKDQFSGVGAVLNVLEMSAERIEEFDDINDTLKNMTELEEKWNLLNQKWKKFLHVLTPFFEDTVNFLNKTLDIIFKEIFNENLNDENTKTKDLAETIQNSSGFKNVEKMYKNILQSTTNSIIGFIRFIKKIYKELTDEIYIDENGIKNTNVSFSDGLKRSFGVKRNKFGTYDPWHIILGDAFINIIEKTGKYILEKKPWLLIGGGLLLFGDKIMIGALAVANLLLAGSNLIMAGTKIVGSLIPVVKNVTTSLWNAGGKQLLGGVAAYEIGVNAADLVDEYGSKAGTGIAYGGHRAWIGLKDFFGGYDSEEEHLNAIRDAQNRYDKGMQNAENTTFRRLNVPGLISAFDDRNGNIYNQSEEMKSINEAKIEQDKQIMENLFNSTFGQDKESKEVFKKMHNTLNEISSDIHVIKNNMQTNNIEGNNYYTLD